MFRKLTIEQYNEILSSKAPTPGGGSALAMVGAMACSLCQMAVEVTLTKGENELLTSSLSTFKRCIDKLQDLAQEDSTAFEKIIAVSRQVSLSSAEIPLHNLLGWKLGPFSELKYPAYYRRITMEVPCCVF